MQTHAARVFHLHRPDEQARSKAGFAHPKHNTNHFGIEPGMIVADFGAGSGHYTIACAEALQGAGRVYAIDVQPDLLRRIKNETDRRGFKYVQTVLGDIEKPHGAKLADHSADFVILSNTLFQLQHPLRALQEAWRVLRPTGRLAIIDWMDSFRGLGPIKKHVLPKERALELAREADFEAIRQFEAGAHHYGLMMRPVPHAKV